MERQYITFTTSHAKVRFGGSLRSAVWTKHRNQQLPSSKTKPPCLVSSQQRSQGHLVSRTYPFLFCRELLVLPWAFWFCREPFGFAVSHLVLPRAFLFCRELFGFAASFLVLPWTIWFCRELFCFAVSFLVSLWTSLVLPRAFWFCSELFCFAVNVFGFAVTYLVLPWTICNCGDSCGPPYFEVL